MAGWAGFRPLYRQTPHWVIPWRLGLFPEFVLGFLGGGGTNMEMCTLEGEWAQDWEQWVEFEGPTVEHLYLDI
jgi:hypothetical protein